VLDTALDLARGVTSGAAAFVEKGLAMAVPMAVGFLANFLRLGNLGERVKEMLEPVQSKVEDAIGKIIDSALAAGRGLLDKLGIGGADGKEDLPFDAGGEHHHLWVDGPEETARVMVASNDPKEYADRLTEFSARRKTDLARDEDAKLAEKAVTRGRAQLRDWKAAKGAARTPLLTALKDTMKDLYGLLGHPDVPESVVGFGTRAAWAKPLTRKAGATKGNEGRSQFPAAWAAKQKSLNIVLDVWRRLHVLSARLHGPDDSRNFILGTQTANSLMYSDAEEPTITRLSQNQGKNVLWYETTYTVHPAPDDYAAKSLLIKSGTWDAAKGKIATTDLTVPVPSDLPSLVIGAININDFGRDVIRDVGLGGSKVAGADGVAHAIRQLVEMHGPFSTWGAFDAALNATPDGVLHASRQKVRDMVFEARNDTPKRLKVR
jgi:hypothetical protein